MFGQPAGRTIRRSLTAVALTAAVGLAACAGAQPGLAAAQPARSVAATQASTTAAGKAKGRWASGYTGRQVHATWAGPGVGFIAWTVALDTSTYKGNAYRSCGGDWTTVNIDLAWNSASLHNGAQLVIVDSVELSNGTWRKVGPVLRISKAVGWPGNPAFDGQYRATVYTPGNVHVVRSQIETWISNSGVAYPDPSGSGDSVTLKQFQRC